MRRHGNAGHTSRNPFLSRKLRRNLAPGRALAVAFGRGWPGGRGWGLGRAFAAHYFRNLWPGYPGLSCRPIKAITEPSPAQPQVRVLILPDLIGIKGPLLIGRASSQMMVPAVTSISLLPEGTIKCPLVLRRSPDPASGPSQHRRTILTLGGSSYVRGHP